MRATVLQHQANELAARCGSDPWRAAEDLDLPVIETRLAGRLTEIYVSDHSEGGSVGLVIDGTGSEAEIRERLAHGIAHHLFHAGNRLDNRAGAHWSGRHEREADDFAALLLVPEDALAHALSENEEPGEWDLADRFSVSPQLMHRRLALREVSLSA